MQKNTFHIRAATIADAAIIADHRTAMLQEIGRLENGTALNQLWDASARALSTLLASGDYLGWLAVSEESLETGDSEVVIGGVGARLLPALPRLSADGTQVVTSPRPHVINVYTIPLWRRRGVAHALIQELLTWAIAAKVDRVTLNASIVALPLYEQLGFQSANGMQWVPKR